MLVWKGFLGQSILAGFLLWSAFPPLGLWPLGVIGVAIYVDMISRAKALKQADYWSIWFGSLLMWLGLLQGIRLAYWPLYFGWLALSLYLAAYTVLFITVARNLVHHRGWSTLWAVPMTWVSIELIRGYLLTGFSGCLLGHSVAKYPWLIQLAAHFGPYGVSAILALAAVLLHTLYRATTESLATRFKPGSATHRDSSFQELHSISSVISIGLIGLTIAYGIWEVRSGDKFAKQSKPLLNVALIQENAPTIFEVNRERSELAWESYLQRTRQATLAYGPLDLIVWPESVFTRNEPIFEWDRATALPASLKAEGVDYGRLKEIVEYMEESNADKLRRLVTESSLSAAADKPYFLLGSEVHRIENSEYHHWNAALWVEPDGKILDFYSKQNLVMFGEYIPFGDWFPFIYDIFTLPRLTAGNQPKRFEIKKEDVRIQIVPSICFENMSPHFIQKQSRVLRQKYGRPDMLINITNDGWFHGSSISDIHLANAIFAAVENRTPVLVAANVGLSAWIDGSGRIQGQVPRLQGAVVFAQPTPEKRFGLWQYISDWPVRMVALVCILVGLKPKLLVACLRRP